MAPRDLTSWINVDQAIAPLSTSLQMESKEASSMSTIELQGKPARRWFPPGTLPIKYRPTNQYGGFKCEASQI